MVGKRLSEKKIHVKCKMEILTTGDGNKLKVVDVIETRFVYRKGPYFDFNLKQPGICYSVIIKDGFIASLCNKYQIKKKFVSFMATDTSNRKSINISEGDDVLVETYSILFLDKDWHVRWNREQQLKKLDI